MKLLFLCGILAALIAAPAAAQTPEAAEHVQPTIATNARNLLNLNGNNEVAMVSHGDVNDFGAMTFILHNGTEDVVTVAEVKADVRDTDGGLMGVAIANPSSIFPTVLFPGDIAVGQIRFSDIDLVSNPDIDFSVASTPGDQSEPMMNVNIHYLGVRWTGLAIVGEVHNPSDKSLFVQPYVVVCVSDDGEVIDGGMGYLYFDMEPGDTSTFQADEVSLSQCDNFIMAGGGS